MPRTPNIHGGGARTNQNGLHFEQTTSLDDALCRLFIRMCGIENRLKAA